MKKFTNKHQLEFICSNFCLEVNAADVIEKAVKQLSFLLDDKYKLIRAIFLFCRICTDYLLIIISHHNNIGSS